MIYKFINYSVRNNLIQKPNYIYLFLISIEAGPQTSWTKSGKDFN